MPHGNKAVVPKIHRDVGARRTLLAQHKLVTFPEHYKNFCKPGVVNLEINIFANFLQIFCNWDCKFFATFSSKNTILQFSLSLI